jgi:membrane fusion protein (multidrug efflux system)
MKALWNIFLVIVLMAGAGAAGYFWGHRAQTATAGDDSDSDADIEPTPTVQTTPIRQGHIDCKIVAYGVVAARSSDVSVLSVPYEARVKQIKVAEGERIGAGAVVMEIEPSADTQLQMVQGKAAYESAAQGLEQTKARFASHLATNQDLLDAQQNLQIARLKLDSMQGEGAGGPAELKSSTGGLVAKVDVQEGQVVPAGTALVEIAGGSRLEVRLGVESSEAAFIKPGDQVALQDLGQSGATMAGTVRLVAQRINPDTRMIDVMASLPADSTLPLGDYLRGEFSAAGSDGLLVPVSAVLPDDEGFSMFTVDQGKAVEHKVTVAVRNDELALISGDGLSAGQAAVTLGNLELEDGMAVKTQGDQVASVGPSTGPSTGEASAAETDK